MINDYIRALSLRDKKTLSQKALKTCEEIGELAKVILPFDSAAGTNHRFIDREKILEEIADVYLTNISIAYSLNFSDEEIDDMISKKAIKWDKMQSIEMQSEFPLPFEIHVTIRPLDNDNFIEIFKENCRYLQVKPIVLELKLDNGYLEDVMTSSKHYGTNRSAYDECLRISNGLKGFGYNVVREKIETVPWHVSAPLIEGNYKEGCYFESHIGVSILEEEKNNLEEFVDNLDSSGLGGSAKLSQNFFKKSIDGSRFINMLTYRNEKCIYTKFDEEVNLIKNSLIENGFKFEKVEIEYAIYDSNIKHDKLWI